MTLSHRLQRSVYSLGIRQPQWINGRWECSNRASGSIHQAREKMLREKHSPCVCASRRACASLCVFVPVITCLWSCGFLCARISLSVHISALRVKTLVDTDESKASTSPNAHSPSSASSRPETANHYLLVFLPSPPLFLWFCPSKVLPWQYAGLISKQQVLSGKSLQRQTQFGYNDWWRRAKHARRCCSRRCSLMNFGDDAGTGSLLNHIEERVY